MIAKTRTRGLTSALGLAVVLMLAGEGRAVEARTAGLTAADATRAAADQRATAARAAAVKAAARRRAEALARRSGGAPAPTPTTTTTTPRTTTTTPRTTTTAPRTTTTTIPQPLDRTAPGVPSGVKATAQNCSEVTLSWNASTDTGGSGLSGYDVYRDGNFWTQVAAPFAGLIDGSRAGSTSYSYQVAAYDKAGNRSARSSAVSARTPSCAGTGPLQRLGSLSGFESSRDLAVDDTTHVAVAPVWRKGIQVVRLDTTTGPSLASTLLAGDTSTVGVAAQGGFAYAVQVVDGATLGVDLVVLDLRQPAAPRVASRLRLPGVYSGAAVAADGTLVYVPSNHALQIVDVANPAAPRILGSVPMSGSGFHDIDLGDGWAFVNLDGLHIAVVDVRSPSRPVVVGTQGWQWTCGAWNRDRLFGISNGKVYAYDVTTPQSARFLGLLDARISARDAAVIGSRAFFATDAGIGVVNISNAAALVSSPMEPSPAPIVRVEASDSGLLVAVDQNGTLTVYSTP